MSGNSLNGANCQIGGYPQVTSCSRWEESKTSLKLDNLSIGMNRTVPIHVKGRESKPFNQNDVICGQALASRGLMSLAKL
jgi:hypothetical protein